MMAFFVSFNLIEYCGADLAVMNEATLLGAHQVQGTTPQLRYSDADTSPSSMSTIRPHDQMSVAKPSFYSAIPWIGFIVFGMVVVSVTVAVVAFTTRCPCEKLTSGTTPHSNKGGSNDNATGAPLVNSKATLYILSWEGDMTPSESLKVHFLLNEEPYSTYSCTGLGIFGLHKRVRVTLPKGNYTIRVVFGDELQSVCSDAPEGGMITLTEGTLSCHAALDQIAAAEAPVGACTKDK